MNQSKSISVIGALQAGEVVFGTLFVTAILKINHYGQNISVDWNPRSVWIRENGWLLIGIPALWLTVALLISARKERIKTIMISGFMIMICLLAFYIDAIVNAYYRPMLFADENHGAQPCVTDNDHSCHGSCCARSAPAAVMSDLKRSAKKPCNPYL